MTSDKPELPQSEQIIDSLQEADELVDALSESATGDEVEVDSEINIESSDPESGVSLKANKKVKAPRRGSGAVSWLALLLSLGALAGSAYLYWQQQTMGDSAQANMQSIDATAKSLKRDLETEVQSRLNSFAVNSDKLMNELSQSNSRLERKLSLDVNELSERLADTEQQIVTLKGFSDAAKRAYIKAEIEYFLQTANNRMQLAQDAQTALAALQAADERLNILKDLSMVRVRAQVRDEIQALKAIDSPDIQGLALTLASISKQVPQLPMRMDDEANYYKEEIPLKQGTGIRVGLSNVWRNMKGTLDQLVEVRDATPSDVPLLSEENERLIYANLDIQLQSARLAALKGDSKNYQLSLEGASRLLTVYFDTEKNAVRSVVESLAEIKDINLTPQLPDISGSLQLLRELRAADAVDNSENPSE
ncbi:MAG: uroporphyrinogen-III C-methyltransferase [Gammaproteobacteria bacterium]|nr:uroporphyrinogen-III C-methyltransferase [Gammaproteobacteria bacterium]